MSPGQCLLLILNQGHTHCEINVELFNLIGSHTLWNKCWAFQSDRVLFRKSTKLVFFSWHWVTCTGMIFKKLVAQPPGWGVIVAHMKMGLGRKLPHTLPAGGEGYLLFSTDNSTRLAKRQEISALKSTVENDKIEAIGRQMKVSLKLWCVVWFQIMLRLD